MVTRLHPHSSNEDRLNAYLEDGEEYEREQQEQLDAIDDLLTRKDGER